MNLVLADNYFPSCSTKPRSYRKAAQDGTGAPWRHPGPLESSSGGGTGPGHVPGCCCCCSGDHDPKNCGHGSRHHREWEEREKPPGHRDPEVGSLVNAAPSPNPKDSPDPGGESNRSTDGRSSSITL